MTDEEGPPPRRGGKLELVLALLIGFALVLIPLLGATAGSYKTASPSFLGFRRVRNAFVAGSEPSEDLVATAREGFSTVIAARARCANLAAELGADRIGELEPGEIRERIKELMTSADRGGLDRQRAFEAALPSPQAASSLLSSDRDLADFKAAATGKGRAGEHYAEMAELVPTMRPLRARYELLLASAYEELAGGAGSFGSASGLGPVARAGDVYPPARASLDNTHPFALDIFFTKVERFAGGVERGPEILSMSPGLVFATAADWRGGAGQASYKSGGFSPNSGNGVIIYDPGTRRFYTYFHLSELAVEAGDAVKKGDVLGRGGDTGANARKSGHGGHVHVEIFDVRRNRALRALEIRELLFED